MQRKTRSIVVLVVCIVLVGAMLAACGDQSAPAAETSPGASSESAASDSAATKEPAAAGGVQRVGVSMPSRASERWIHDGGNIQEQLEAKGYEVDLQFAEDNVQTQASQLENMMTNGADCLVVVPVDAGAMVNVLQQAKGLDIPVIAYDRMITDSQNVDYYVTFDNIQVGRTMVKEVSEQLQGDGPYNIEIFTGSPDDSNAYTAYEGIMAELQPLIDSGKFVVKSGQTDFEQVAIFRWDQEATQKRMEDLISSYYSDGDKIDAVVLPADMMSYGVQSACEAAGYAPGSEDWPLITGQDAEVMALKNINSGRQFLTMFRDPRIEAEKCVSMVDAVLKGTEPEINDTERFDNGVKVVPTYVCDAVPITKENMYDILVADGYMDGAEIGLE